ncbi:MAG: LacI family DNA-binding transcriptional regulator [Thermoleophilia bacterium]|nr:LacI family DNA-binding transcriptional regulator [Thermoleophilia bacterium]
MAARQRTRPTIYDVAREAGVSTATVSRMLNDTGQIAPATREAIEQAIERLGYLPNTIARSLVTKSTQTIAFLLPDITNPFYASLVSGIQQVALESGHTMLLCTTEGDPERELEYLNLLRAKQVDGALMDGLVVPPERIAQFVADGFPIVCLDRDVRSRSVPLVQVDNKLGARLAMEHLLGLGHRRIAHIEGAPELRISAQRLGGYREALAAAGIREDPRLVATGRFSEDGGYEATRELLGRDVSFTAVFAANDLSAIGAINALTQSGLRVPEDVSVIGFDDLRLSAHTIPPLTTIHQPAVEIARRATEILIDLINGRRVRKLRYLLEPTLVVRSSTAPAPRRRRGRGDP